jgi:copper ion binding protein
MQTVYTVKGMSCQHCVDTVSDEIGKVDGVTDVQVELRNGLVTVSSTGPLAQLAVEVAVAEAGYEIAGAHL